MTETFAALAHGFAIALTPVNLLWGFVDQVPRHNAWTSLAQVPAQTPESDLMSRELKRRGFSFVGSTICQALMQAVGMVNDHTLDCFRYRQLGG